METMKYYSNSYFGYHYMDKENNRILSVTDFPKCFRVSRRYPVIYGSIIHLITIQFQFFFFHKIEFRLSFRCSDTFDNKYAQWNDQCSKPTTLYSECPANQG